MRILVLDDDQARIRTFRYWLRPHDVTFARTAREAIAFLSRDQFDLIFLDHDLEGKAFVPSEDSRCGAEVARYLREHQIKVRTIVHSHNPEGAAYILKLIPHAQAVPWGEDLSARLEALLPESAVVFGGHQTLSDS